MLERYHWVTFLLPFLVFSLVTMLEPTPEKVGGKAIGLAIPYAYYPLVYVVKVTLTVAAIWFVLPGYRRFLLRVSPLAVVVGVLGVVVWIGLCLVDREYKLLNSLLEPIRLDWIIASSQRSAFNPFDEVAAHPIWAWGILAIRFAGLVAVVPIIEEFFLRGFLMRFVVDRDWWEVPIGKVNTLAVVIGTLLYPMLSHPAELLAAVVWFSMVTWLMVKTRSIWDCVAAHAVTNLLLGIYVVATGEWQLM